MQNVMDFWIKLPTTKLSFYGRSCRERLVGTSEKSFFMENIFSKNINFHVTFSLLDSKINYFSLTKEKYQF